MPVHRSESARHCAASGTGTPAGRSNRMKSLPSPCILVKSMRMGAKHSPLGIADWGDAPGTAPGRRRQALRSTALAGGFHLQPCVQPSLVGLIVGQVLALAIGARAVDTPSLDGLLIAVLRFLALVRVDLFEVVMQRALCVGR